MQVDSLPLSHQESPKFNVWDPANKMDKRQISRRKEIEFIYMCNVNSLEKLRDE